MIPCTAFSKNGPDVWFHDMGFVILFSATLLVKLLCSQKLLPSTRSIQLNQSSIQLNPSSIQLDPARSKLDPAQFSLIEARSCSIKLDSAWFGSIQLNWSSIPVDPARSRAIKLYSAWFPPPFNSIPARLRSIQVFRGRCIPFHISYSRRSWPTLPYGAVKNVQLLNTYINIHRVWTQLTVHLKMLWTAKAR